MVSKSVFCTHIGRNISDIYIVCMSVWRAGGKRVGYAAAVCESVGSKCDLAEPRQHLPFRVALRDFHRQGI